MDGHTGRIHMGDGAFDQKENPDKKRELQDHGQNQSAEQNTIGLGRGILIHDRHPLNGYAFKAALSTDTRNAWIIFNAASADDYTARLYVRSRPAGTTRKT